MGSPGHLQFIDVLLVNLIQGSKTVTMGGITPMFPVFLLFTGGYRFNRHRFGSRNQRLWLEHTTNACQQRDSNNRRKGKRQAFFSWLGGRHKRPDQRTEESQHAKGKQT